jgi:hypothetical protein
VRRPTWGRCPFSDTTWPEACESPRTYMTLASRPITRRNIPNQTAGASVWAWFGTNRAKPKASHPLSSRRERAEFNSNLGTWVVCCCRSFADVQRGGCEAGGYTWTVKCMVARKDGSRLASRLGFVDACWSSRGAWSTCIDVVYTSLCHQPRTPKSRSLSRVIVLLMTLADVRLCKLELVEIIRPSWRCPFSNPQVTKPSSHA